MNEEKISLRMMPWKHKLVLVVMAVISIQLCVYNSSSSMNGFKYILFFFLLLCGSYFDFKKRMIPDWIHIVLVIVGLININIARSVIGLLISPLPFLVMALINTGSIGGGDIKLIGSSGFVLGFGSTITASTIGLVVAILFYSMYYLGYKRARCIAFPFAPFFQVGCMVVQFLITME